MDKLDKKSSQDLENDLRKSFKNIKLKKTLKIILISVLSAILVFFALIFGGKFYYDYLSQDYVRTAQSANNYNQLEAPNIFLRSQSQLPYNLFARAVYSDSYKNVDGYQVPWISQEWTGNIDPITDFEAINTNDGDAFMNQTGQKLASFFVLGVDRKSDDYAWLPEPTHEASEIAKVPNHLVEVAVTFDKKYSYAEIQKMIPENLLINWYWFGGDIGTTISGLKPGIPNNYGISSDSKIENATSFQSGDLTGKISNESYKSYVQTFKKPGYDRPDIKIDGASYVVGDRHLEIPDNLQDAKFAGVILTGRTENFANFDKKKWVYATNTGLLTEIRPDVKPTK